MGMNSQNIVILGAGYSGIMAANQLAANHNITVINSRPHFVERIRLHQFVTGGYAPQVPFSTILHPEARVVVAHAQRIDAHARRVVLDDGSAVDYDYLIYAAGSRVTRPELPGAEHAYAVGEWEHAQKLRDALADGPRAVTVIGGGLTGIETASELAEMMPDVQVTLVTAGLVSPGFSQRGRGAVLRTLEALGVRVYENAPVRRITKTSVQTNANTLPSDVTIMTTGMQAVSLAGESGLTTDGIGRLVTDSALRSVDDGRIIGTGDAAAPPAEVAGHIRMSCAAALPLGAMAARTVDSLIAGDEPEPILFGYMIQCLSLGRRHGVVQRVRPDDQPRNFALTGRTGAFVKEQICRSTLRWMAGQIEKPGSLWWPRGPRATVEASRKVRVS